MPLLRVGPLNLNRDTELSLTTKPLPSYFDSTVYLVARDILKRTLGDQAKVISRAVWNRTRNRWEGVVRYRGAFHRWTIK